MTCGGRARDLAARVEVEQLGCVISLDRRARLVALLRPALAAELVQARRRRVVVHVAGGAVRSIWSMRYSGTLSRSPPSYSMTATSMVLSRMKIVLDAAVDADAVLQVHHVVAGLERGDRSSAARWRSGARAGCGARAGRSRGR
jgi:hypothetical protein